MSRHPANTLTLTTAVLALFYSPVLADKHIVEEVTLESGKTAEVQVWLGARRSARLDTLSNITTIVRRDLKKLFVVMNAEKQVIEVDLPVALPADLAGMFSELKMNWQTSTVGENRKINDWDCRKVMIRGRGTVSVDIEMWVTETAGFDTKAFYLDLGDSLQLSPLFSGLGESLVGLGGAFSVEASISVNKLGVRSSSVTRVKSISNEPPLPDAYEPPKDYQRLKLDFSTFLTLLRLHYHPGIPEGV
jgi:hypothetical protein